MRASLARRVRKLESGLGGACPYCSGREHVLLRDAQPVPVCAVCQQPLPAVRLIFVENFYDNFERLQQLSEQQEEDLAGIHRRG
jgi:hypothetical protein